MYYLCNSSRNCSEHQLAFVTSGTDLASSLGEGGEEGSQLCLPWGLAAQLGVLTHSLEFAGMHPYHFLPKFWERCVCSQTHISSCMARWELQCSSPVVVHASLDNRENMTVSTLFFTQQFIQDIFFRFKS